MGRLNASWNSVIQRAMAWSFSQSCGRLHIGYYACVTFCSDVHRGSVGRVFFHAEDVGSNLALVTFFFKKNVFRISLISLRQTSIAM